MGKTKIKQSNSRAGADQNMRVSAGGPLATIAGLGLVAAALATGIWLGSGGSQQAAAPAPDAAGQAAPMGGAANVQRAPAQQAPSNPAAVVGSAGHSGGMNGDSATASNASPADGSASSMETAPGGAPNNEPAVAAEAEDAAPIEAEPVVIEDLYVPTGEATDAEGLTAAEEGRIGQPTLVFFHADWCHVCQEIQPEMTEIQAEYADKVAFVKMNIDHAEGRPASQRYAVRGTPTFVMFDATGRKVQQFSGWPGGPQMTGLMDSVVALQ